MQRLLTVVFALSLAFVGSAGGAARSAAGIWEESRFQTGCDPGPYHTPPAPEHRETHYPQLDASPDPVALQIDVDSAAAQPPLLGSGFNLEHALWSCPEFRSIFRSEVLDPFKPSVARVDTGLLPAAPAELPAQDLGPAVYQSVLASAAYASSWGLFHHLNRAGVRIVLGVWGGPAQFTRDGTRRGVLERAHYDDYVEYVATVVDYIVRVQGIQVWATTIANEPDGGDGNQIPPDGLAYIAHRLAPRLAALDVMLYGPDTANGDHALQYLALLLDDPVVADRMAFIGFHQYYSSAEVEMVVNYAHQRRADLPVIVTEYTSFGFGDLDDGQEANAQMGFTLDIATTLLSHYRHGVDAALYWDAVDYLQPGHDALTRWGFLRGPTEDFQRRQRYYGMQQILTYLRPGTRLLRDAYSASDQFHTLSVQTPEGVPVIFLINQDFGLLDLTLSLQGIEAARLGSLVVTQTDRTHRAERTGRVDLQDGMARMSLAPRSIVTLFPAGAGPLPED